PFPVGAAFEDIPLNITTTTKEREIRKIIDNHFEKIEQAVLVISTHEHRARLQRIWESVNYDLGAALSKLAIELAAEKALQEQMSKITPSEISKPTPTPIINENVITKKPEVVTTAKPKIEAEEVTTYKFSIDLTETELNEFVSFLESRNINY